ncbi:MAG: hypothetical protein VX463_12370, partial [Pseudomonadota bacterium]|nr:hypothetical protein [Pseudomonadota bacterium]
GAPLGRAGDGACVEGAPAGAPPGLRAMAEQGRLTRVTVAEGATVRTERGVGVGDPAEAVDAAYGARVVTRPAKYEPRPAETKTVWTTGAPVGRDWTDDETARGLRFEIGTDGRVQAIHGGGVSIQYAEGCS